MKRFIFSIFLFLMVTSNVHAQGINKPEFYANSGISFSIAPDEFTHYWRTGFNLGIGIGYPVNPYLRFMGNVDFNRFRFDDNNYHIGKGEATIITLSENLKASLTLSEKIIPYICGGIGYFHISESYITFFRFDGSSPAEDDPEDAFSVLFGAGMDFAVGERTGLFIEGRYVIGFTENESIQILPIKIGIKFR